MRQSLMGTFRRLRVLDLHGNATRRRQSPDGSEDKNVFDIQQGVAICLAHARRHATPAVRTRRLWGTREAKYAWLAKHSASDDCVRAADADSPFYFFEPQNTDCRAEYDASARAHRSDACSERRASTPHATTSSSVSTSDDLRRTDCDFVDLSVRTLIATSCSRQRSRLRAGDTRDWKLPKARRRLRATRMESSFVQCLYRPFDFAVQSTTPSEWWIGLAPETSCATCSHGETLASRAPRQVRGGTSSMSSCTTRSRMRTLLSSLTGRELHLSRCTSYPRAAIGLKLDRQHAQPNFSPAFLRALAATLATAAVEAARPARRPDARRHLPLRLRGVSQSRLPEPLRGVSED